MKQGQNCKKTKYVNQALGQRGQAAVEYVLLLVVIVSMVIAAKGLFSGVNNFIGGYIGDYFSCLMNHGELPQLNVAEDNLKKHTTSSYKCSVQFTIANGATLVGGGGGSSSGIGGRSGSNTSSSNSTSNSNSSSKASNSKSKRGSSGNGGDDSSGGGGGSGVSTYAKGRIQRSNSGSGTADGASDGAATKTKLIEADQVAGSAYGRRGNDGSGGTEYRYNKYKAITSGQMFDDIQKKSGREPRRPGVQTVSKLAVEEGFRPGPRRNTFIPPERKPAAESEDADPNFGFEKMMKWLMIAGMVVAIIVFFGGQIMNYSNSE